MSTQPTPATNKNNNLKPEDFSSKNVISHSKEYGFIFPSSEIYDGLSAVMIMGNWLLN